MADIINTPRGPVFMPTGSIRGLYYIMPVLAPFTVTLANLWQRPPYEREYYFRNRQTGEWDWAYTETANHQRYPAPPPPPEHPLPEGV